MSGRSEESSIQNIAHLDSECNNKTSYNNQMAQKRSHNQDGGESYDISY